MKNSGTNFKQKVINLVKQIPTGCVASYGQIALYANAPKAAREVGWILNQTKVDLPWWRVVNNAGRISIKGAGEATPQQQRKLLLSEGVLVDDEFSFDIEAFRWKPKSL